MQFFRLFTVHPFAIRLTIWVNSLKGSPCYFISAIQLCADVYFTIVSNCQIISISPTGFAVVVSGIGKYIAVLTNKARGANTYRKYLTI